MLYVASCADGSFPADGVILDAAGNFYGTTVIGGTNGQGVVFSLTPSGTETVLYSFCSKWDLPRREGPGSKLVALSPGNLYGTTTEGGTNDSGHGVPAVGLRLRYSCRSSKALAGPRSGEFRVQFLGCQVPGNEASVREKVSASEAEANSGTWTKRANSRCGAGCANGG